MYIKTSKERNDPRRHFRFTTDSQVREWLVCRERTDLFLGNTQIIHNDQGKIPFRCYPFQKAVLAKFATEKDNISLKPRQMGITTVTAGHVLHQAQWTPYFNSLYISMQGRASRAFLRKMAIMWKELPDHLRMPVVNGEKAGDFGSADYVEFANGSTLKALPATEDAGRSDSTNLLVMDEVAFQRYASSIWTAARPTLGKHGRTIMFSTPFGMSNLFYEMWVGATQGLNGFCPIRLHWKMHPERNQEWYNGEAAVMGRKRMAQEIDCSFLASGSNVFNMGAIRDIEDRLKEPDNKPLHVYKDRYRLRNGQMLKFEGEVRIYREAEEGRTYFIGGDVSKGLRSSDYSALSVIDGASPDRPRTEYANFKGKISTTDLGELMADLGYRYNRAWVGPENNGVGEGVIVALQRIKYPRIWKMVERKRRGDEYDYRITNIPGWTTGRNRTDMIDTLDEDLEKERLILNNGFFCAECYTFTYAENNKPVAQNKGRKTKGEQMYEDEQENIRQSDDSIFSVAITNLMSLTPKAVLRDMALLI